MLPGNQIQHNAYSHQPAPSLQATVVQNRSDIATVFGSSTISQHQPDGRLQLASASSSAAASNSQALPPVSTGQQISGLSSGPATSGTLLMMQMQPANNQVQLMAQPHVSLTSVTGQSSVAQHFHGSISPHSAAARVVFKTV